MEVLAASVTESTARKLEPKLPEVTARIQKGEDPAEVIQAVAQEAKKPKAQEEDAPEGIEDYDPSQDEDVHTELVRALEETLHLQEIIERMQTDDDKRQIVQLKEQYRQLEERLQGEMAAADQLRRFYGQVAGCHVY